MNDKTSKFAKVILDDLGIFSLIGEIVEFFDRELINSNTEEENDDLGKYEYLDFFAYKNGEFNHIFDKNLNEKQKSNLIKNYLTDDKFKVNATYEFKKKLEIDFALKIKRLEINNFGSMILSFKYPNRNRLEYTFTAEFLEEIDDDEIEKIHMMYELIN